MEDDPGDGGDVRARVLQQTLEEIPPQRMRDDDGDDPDAPRACVICLDTVSEPCIAGPCGHRNFDYVCLLSWIEQRNACPLCNSTISTLKYRLADDVSFRNHKLELPSPRSDPHGYLEAERRPDHPHEYLGFVTRWPGRPVARPRQPRFPRPPPPRPSPGEAVLRRRSIYRENLYSLHVGANRISRYTTLTPQLFASDPELVSRARTWIRRELQVFEYLSGEPQSDGAAPSSSPAGGSSGGRSTNPARQRRADNAHFLLEYIIAILKTVDIQGSCGEAEDMLQDFLGRAHTRLFLHELRAWLRSPYTSLEDWDRNVQYAEPQQPSRPALGYRTFIRDPERSARRREAIDENQDLRRGLKFRYDPYGRRIRE